MCYLYIKTYIKNNLIKTHKKDTRRKYKVIHSCVISNNISNKGEYIKDITNLVKMYKVCPNTKIEFYKSLIKDQDVVIHVYFNEELGNKDIEIKHVLT